MVIEHTFITTLDGPDALLIARDLLVSRGFAPPAPSQLAGRLVPPNVLELRRGRDTPERAKSVMELPQFVRLEWDRGRVTVAASVTPHSWMGRQHAPGSLLSQPIDKPQPDQEGLLLAIVGALELLLAHCRPPDECVAGLDQVQYHLVEKARASRRRGWIVVGAIVFVVAGVIVLAALMAG